MPAIDTTIFQKHGTSIPAVLTPVIRGLCEEVSPGSEPEFLDVRPEPDAIEGECFHNVNRKVERDGGAIVYGWAIWEWPRVFVEAEHHAVWSDGTQMIDVTPHIPRYSRVLFLPDPTRVYDYVGKKRHLNIKRSVGTFWSAQAWVDASHRLQQYMEDCSEGGIMRMNRQIAKELWHEARQAHAHVLVDLAKTTGRNDPCFCQSGLKFKKCCSRLIDLSV